MIVFISICTKFYLGKMQARIQLVYFAIAIVVISVAAFTFAK